MEQNREFLLKNNQLYKTWQSLITQMKENFMVRETKDNTNPQKRKKPNFKPALINSMVFQIPGKTAVLIKMLLNKWNNKIIILLDNKKDN